MAGFGRWTGGPSHGSVTGEERFRNRREAAPEGVGAMGPQAGSAASRVGNPSGQWLGPPGVAAGSGPAAASFSL